MIKVVGPKPQRRDYWTRGITGKIFRQQAYDDAVAAWRQRKDEERDEQRQRPQETAFKESTRPDGKTDTYFNAPGDGSRHGHHVRNPDGSTEYVRDPQGEVYVDRSKER
jgi:hypothetical protein